MTTEELKREMYRQFKNLEIAGFFGKEIMGHFESALEAYLEELRKDLNFACSCVDLSALKAAKLIEERDQLRSKLQAFEFANKSAGELLIHAQETIRKQRQFIRTLYTSRKARKVRPGTLAQSEKGKAVCGTCGGRGSVLAMGEWDHFARDINCPSCSSQFK